MEASCVVEVLTEEDDESAESSLHLFVVMVGGGRGGKALDERAPQQSDRPGGAWASAAAKELRSSSSCSRVDSERLLMLMGNVKNDPLVVLFKNCIWLRGIYWSIDGRTRKLAGESSVRTFHRSGQCVL